MKAVFAAFMNSPGLHRGFAWLPWRPRHMTGGRCCRESRRAARWTRRTERPQDQNWNRSKGGETAATPDLHALPSPRTSPSGFHGDAPRSQSAVGWRQKPPMLFKNILFDPWKRSRIQCWREKSKLCSCSFLSSSFFCRFHFNLRPHRNSLASCSAPAVTRPGGSSSSQRRLWHRKTNSLSFKRTSDSRLIAARVSPRQPAETSWLPVKQPRKTEREEKSHEIPRKKETRGSERPSEDINSFNKNKEERIKTHLDSPVPNLQEEDTERTKRSRV